MWSHMTDNNMSNKWIPNHFLACSIKSKMNFKVNEVPQVYFHYWYLLLYYFKRKCESDHNIKSRGISPNETLIRLSLSPNETLIRLSQESVRTLSQLTETNLNVVDEKLKDMSVVSEEIECFDEDVKTKSEEDLILENLEDLSFKDACNN